MTYERREEIFSKEVITTAELGELLGLEMTRASMLMQEIKRNMPCRIRIKGRLHVQDYLDYFCIPPSERYYKKEKGESV